jgi:hypothetical protein
VSNHAVAPRACAFSLSPLSLSATATGGRGLQGGKPNDVSSRAGGPVLTTELFAKLFAKKEIHFDSFTVLAASSHFAERTLKT